MLAFLLSLFKPRSVAAILNDFSQKIEELEKAQAYQTQQEKKEQQAASDALVRADEARKEAARAQNVRAKIESLING